MKKLNLTKLSLTKLSLAEMEAINGGRTGSIVGIRIYGGTCYLDIHYAGDADVTCEVPYPAAFCDGVHITT